MKIERVSHLSTSGKKYTQMLTLPQKTIMIQHRTDVFSDKKLEVKGRREVESI